MIEEYVNILYYEKVGGYIILGIMSIAFLILCFMYGCSLIKEKSKRGKTNEG